MKTLMALMICLTSSVGVASDYLTDKHSPSAEWGYSGQGKLSPNKWFSYKDDQGNHPYALCEEGVRKNERQSPIDLKKRFGIKTTSKLDIQYRATTFAVYHNRHTVEFEDRAKESSNKVTFEGVSYTLKQFHYHRPSEHLIDGEERDFEIHFVHAAADGKLLVIGVLGEVQEESEGDSFSRELTKMLAKYRGTGEPEVSVDVENVDLNALLPVAKKRIFFTYKGSLTTPPCSETVTWIVMVKPVTISQAKLTEVTEKKFGIGFLNARPAAEYNPESQQLRLSGKFK